MERNMNKLLNIFFFIVLGPSILSAQEVTQNPVELIFEQKHIDLGKVMKGETKTFDYNFTNIGTDTIEISIVSGCDCTTLDWTQGKIAPGEKGIINVIFDSSKKEQSETVDVDMYLTNINPITDSQYFYILDYEYILNE